MSKEILVTGSSRGIGKEIALYLANSGYDVVLNCRNNIEQALEVQKQIQAAGQKARVLQFDVKDRKKCFEILENDIKQNGVYFGVVLNAGIARDNVFPIMTETEWDDVIGTNLGSFYNVLKPVIMPMIEKKIKGRIVTLSSISGLRGNRGQVNYSASKAGIIGASKALAAELASRSITVNVIAPGIIETDMIEGIPVEEMLKAVPMKRLGKPEEIAALASFLLSEDAGYITRQVISVNGGLC